MKRLSQATCFTFALLLTVAAQAQPVDGADPTHEEASPPDVVAPEEVVAPAGLPEAPVEVSGGVAVPVRETLCTDGLDNDGDTVTDCGDADCAGDPACKADGGAESDDARCSDWVDNDNDGHTDCDDEDCAQSWVKVCQGSWKGPLEGGGGMAGAGDDDDLPPIGQGQSVEDLIGNFGDVDGERNDIDCADGVDNDGDGMTDCVDFGCRFDPQVTVCRSSPGLRFSVVAQVGAEYGRQEKEGVENPGWRPDTRFNALQMRVMGPIPLIQDSFFLLSMRAEKTPRLTFAMFQVPIGGGHYMNINSGGGGLSSALIRSRSKQLLVDPPYYLYNAFEQGNGAAIEVGGPLTTTLDYRVFAAGGSGRFAGNVGGRYFTYDNENYTWNAGAQIAFDIIGNVSRWDNPMLYTPAALAVGMSVGGKYDERAQERYPSGNAQLVVRWKYVVALVEGYFKRELEFVSDQFAYNIQVGVLVWPKHLLLAADFGEYQADDMSNPPDVLETDIRKQRDELMWRVALHWYYWRNIGVMSLVYSDRDLEQRDEYNNEVNREQKFEIVAQYRF